MNVELIRASMADAEQIWHMQRTAFADLLARYQDYDTNPACEPLEKVRWRMAQPATHFYFIQTEGEVAGAIRVVDAHDGSPKRVSPLFVMPEHRGKGVAQAALRAAEAIHGSNNWQLLTILQEPGNCHLYEKMGYRQAGVAKVVNEKMTLVIYEK